jgi:hypothetical protein
MARATECGTHTARARVPGITQENRDEVQASGRRGRDGTMSLRAGQQRSLNRIEQGLLDDDIHLVALFEFFTRLARGEAMPPTEQAVVRPSRRRRALAAAIALAAVASVIIFSALLAGPRACPGRAAAGPARTQPLRSGPPAPCPARTGRAAPVPAHLGG